MLGNKKHRLNPDSKDKINRQTWAPVTSNAANAPDNSLSLKKKLDTVIAGNFKSVKKERELDKPLNEKIRKETSIKDKNEKKEDKKKDEAILFEVEEDKTQKSKSLKIGSAIEVTGKRTKSGRIIESGYAVQANSKPPKKLVKTSSLSFPAQQPVMPLNVTQKSTSVSLSMKTQSTQPSVVSEGPLNKTLHLTQKNADGGSNVAKTLKGLGSASKKKPKNKAFLKKKKTEVEAGASISSDSKTIDSLREDDEGRNKYVNLANVCSDIDYDEKQNEGDK
uniref:Uncharacterized protein n=1 Tax=Rhabditophanes sp. KR3021 TaxID=114890 RepID=A0AC35TW24_9BILA